MLTRRFVICRFYLPGLAETESAEFFREFDSFWGQLISHFDHVHSCWRNAASSKMQECENSASYLALALFTLAKKSNKDSLCIVILCASLEEENEWKLMMFPPNGLSRFILPPYWRSVNFEGFWFVSLSRYNKYAPQYVVE